ncbi:MAG: hypothetical protein AAF772_09510, partial [Acidobacteriota bacterium]
DPDGQVPILFKTAAKLAIKGGDIAATTAGIVEDAKTLVSPDATAGERSLAAVSLLSEVVSPVSVRDAKLSVNFAETAGDASKGIDRVVDSSEATINTTVTAADTLSRLSTSQLKSIRSLEKRIAEHQQKLRDFQANPTVRPGMEGATEQAIRAQQAARIRHLKAEIRAFEGSIRKIRSGGSE